MSDDTAPRGGATLTSDIGKYTMVPEWVMFAELKDGKPISDRAIRLFAVLGRCINDTGQGTIYRSTLARKLGGCSKASVDRARDELVDIGALKVARRKVQGSKENAASAYVLMFGMPENVRLMVAAHLSTPLITGDDEVAPPVMTGGSTGDEEEENFYQEITPSDLMTKVDECPRCSGTTWVPDLRDATEVLPCPDCNPRAADINPERYLEPEVDGTASDFIAAAKARQHGVIGVSV